VWVRAGRGPPDEERREESMLHLAGFETNREPYGRRERPDAEGMRKRQREKYSIFGLG